MLIPGRFLLSLICDVPFAWQRTKACGEASHFWNIEKEVALHGVRNDRGGFSSVPNIFPQVSDHRFAQIQDGGDVEVELNVRFDFALGGDGPKLAVVEFMMVAR